MIIAPQLAPLWGALSGLINSGTIKGAAIGAFSAAVFQGIGNGFAKLAEGARSAGVAAQNLVRAGKVLAHGIAGGVMSELQLVMVFGLQDLLRHLRGRLAALTQVLWGLVRNVLSRRQSWAARPQN